MKKIIKSLLCLLVALTLIMAGCGKSSDKASVTFKQNGQADVVREAEIGTSLKDIPSPVEKAGYTVAWDITDFSNITKDVVVNAVEKPNEYTVTYTYDGRLENSYTVTLEKQSQTVTFDAEFTVANAPQISGAVTLVFKGWKISGTETYLTSGVYTTVGNVTVVAEFSPIDQEWS